MRTESTQQFVVPITGERFDCLVEGWVLCWRWGGCFYRWAPPNEARTSREEGFAAGAEVEYSSSGCLYRAHIVPPKGRSKNITIFWSRRTQSATRRRDKHRTYANQSRSSATHRENTARTYTWRTLLHPHAGEVLTIARTHHATAVTPNPSSSPSSPP